MPNYTIQELFELACEEDKIPTDTEFAVFSENNYWAKQYDKAVSLYCKYQVAMRQMTGG